MAESPQYDVTKLPDYDTEFVNEDDINAFERALKAPDANEEEFIVALNDWRPVNQKIRKKKARPRRGKDETREGIVYLILKWPLFFLIGIWIIFLSVLYLLTRFYISQYEYWITWRGKRQRLRRALHQAKTYEEWVEHAQALDKYLGADTWKESEQFAYYDYTTIRRILTDMKSLREKATSERERGTSEGPDRVQDTQAAKEGKAERPGSATEELRTLLEACVKSNFGGIESARLYSQTYHGTKRLLQEYIDEVERCLKFILETDTLSREDKKVFYKHLHHNFGRTALCLSGGATFAYYHFGVLRALLDADLLPKVITGTSGGALVAALICTRTDTELRDILVPELAHKITACHEGAAIWLFRWWKTGARFDAVDWARRCSWFTRGSMTFKEAYKRTGRVLNISCIPSDPHSPSLLLNHITAPDCVIWSATIASAAVPGILNPVVLMMKTKSGALMPFSFGHKWKDGSLRTDIPLRALNLHFNVNFSIVSQVNPHVNIFFFSSRGTVGRPVTHRKGRGWRGGFLGSALEQYLKLDLAKWLKVLRHLELLPRPMSQDWSSLWLQKFDGNITIWPKSIPSDFLHILSDPRPERLARMLQVGQSQTFPKLLFISNRLRIERLIERGRRKTKDALSRPQSSAGLAELDTSGFRRRKRPGALTSGRGEFEREYSPSAQLLADQHHSAKTFPQPTASAQSGRKPSWFGSWSLGGGSSSNGGMVQSPGSLDIPPEQRDTGSIRASRRGSALEELQRQGSALFGFQDESEFSDDSDEYDEEREGDDDEDREPGREDRWHLSTASEGGDTDGDGEAEMVQGGGRALL